MPNPCRLVRGDCTPLLAGLKGQARLVVADPPYDFGQPYDAYSDNLGHDAYMAFTRGWLGAAVEALHPHGAIWVFAPDEWDAEIRVMAKREFKLVERRKVVWAFTFGQAARKNFTRSHCNIIYFTKAKTRFTFNEAELRVPSARQLVYKDRRANPAGKLPDDVWMLLEDQLAPHMTPDRDVWLVSRVCGTFGERKPHSPNQIPEAVVSRIVRACSNPGDLVVSPFLGSGTDAKVCADLGRPFWGCDLSERCVRESAARVASVTFGGEPVPVTVTGLPVPA